MFDLAMFDSFEIHITKKEFYSKFGTGIRPAKEDYLFFCQINKWFKVEHAHLVRNYNNSGVYYKLILVRKQNDKNIDNGVESTFEMTTLNNSLENLFGNIVNNNINKVSNKQIQENLTETDNDYHEKFDNVLIEDSSVLNITKLDLIRYSMYANIVNNEIINATTIINKSYYNLENRTNKDAIVYGYVDNMDICTKRGISLWFNIFSYKQGQVYNLLNNYNNVTKQGYRIDFIDGIIEIIYFEQSFTFDVRISPNKWYGLILNIDHIKSTIELSIHRRKKDGNDINTNLDIINEYVTDINVRYGSELIYMKVEGSPMYWANLRVFDDIIVNKDTILNQLVIRDTDKLLVGDNNEGMIISPSHKF